jgi:hypothetical protein
MTLTFSSVRSTSLCAALSPMDWTALIVGGRLVCFLQR